MTRRDAALLVAVAVVAGVLVPVAALLAPAPSGATGATWSFTASPDATTTANDFLGVSCPTATSCIAVGFHTTPSGARRTLVESGSGTTWSLVASPNSGTRDNSLASVACPTATDCIAVGTVDRGARLDTLAEIWNGSAWSIAASPPARTVLDAVACTAVAACTAVGYSVDPAGATAPAAASWDGAAWTVAPLPDAGPSADTALDGISCPSGSSCTAVGYRLDPVGILRPLVEHWDGAAWSVVPSPSPSTGGTLVGVSCASANSCTAVGWAGIGARRTLVDTWNGTAWSEAASANRTANINYLRSVACTVTAVCTAVGWSDNGTVTHTIVETKVGSSWVLSPVTDHGTVDNELASIACPTSTRCVATGRFSNSVVARTLVMTATAPADTAAPSITVTTPAAGGYYVTGQDVRAAYSCPDSGGSGIATCAGTVAAGSPVDTSAAGAGTFSVTATDGAGNSASRTVGYTIVDPVTAATTFPAGGGSVSTDPGGGPTPSRPVTTTLAGSDAGGASIDEGVVTIAAPSGFTVLGMQVDTTAPAAGAAAPLRLTFDVDAAMVPPGTAAGALSLLDAGALVPDCAGATTLPAGVATCVTSRADAPSGGGDLRIVALADAGGTFDLALGAATLPALKAAPGAVAEGNSGTSTMNVAVTLGKPSALPVSVHYATVDGSALAGSDYVATSGTLSFAPGQVNAGFPVSIIGDTRREPDETFVAHLSSAAGATIAVSSASEVVLDDDRTVPGTPTSVSAVGGDASAVVSWHPPGDNGGLAVGGYVVTPYVSGVAQEPRVLTTAQSSATLTGLTNGTTYSFRVAASNALGTGAASAGSPATTAGVPGMPGTTATSSSGRAVVQWVRPSGNGSTVTSYKVVTSLNGVVQQTHVVTCTQPCTPATTYTVTGLTNQDKYKFAVTAANAVGSGPAGSTTIVVSATPAAPAKMATPIASAGKGTISVKWVAPTAGTSSITEFLIEIYQNGVLNRRSNGTPSQTTKSFSLVAAGASYTFRIQARNAIGTGPLSNASNAVKPT